MDTALLRWLIRVRLEDGRLPHGDIAGLIETRGEGHRCDACGTAFETYERAHSAVVIEDWTELWFHRRVFNSGTPSDSPTIVSRP